MREKENSGADEPTSGRINRRKFIQTLSVAGGTVAGATGSATIFASDRARAAQEKTLASVDGTTSKEAVEQYENIDVVRQEVLKYASDFLQKLNEDGYLRSSGINTFDFSEIKAPIETIQSGKGVAVAAVPIGDGEYVAEFTLLTTTAKGPLEVTVIPEMDRTFATLNPRDDENYTPLEETDSGITPSDFCQSKKVCFGPYKICTRQNPARKYRVTHCASGKCTHSPLSCCSNVNCTAQYICGC